MSNDPEPDSIFIDRSNSIAYREPIRNAYMTYTTTPGPALRLDTGWPRSSCVGRIFQMHPIRVAIFVGWSDWVPVGAIGIATSRHPTPNVICSSCRELRDRVRAWTCALVSLFCCCAYRRQDCQKKTPLSRMVDCNLVHYLLHPAARRARSMIFMNASRTS